ncbi:glycosyltransferase family 39 protein [candidate division FCPU426 bacterium]|nr:glycosyltransferase family 39 protein [candidate division FCPU426 bacterium]
MLKIPRYFSGPWLQHRGVGYAGMGLVFLLAFILRIVCLLQYSSAPDFTDPVGDASTYYEQAQLLLAGHDPWKNTVPFQSPFYAVYLFLVFILFGTGFFIPRLIQILAGAANCLLIILLARKVAPERKWAPWLAGLFAAACGVLVFFEISLLASGWELLLMDAGLLLLIMHADTRKNLWAGLAGMVFGLTVVARTNVILFLPVAIWYLYNRLSGLAHKGSWQPVAGFLGGCLLMILPVTLHNYIQAGDLSLVSSNGGINFYIGNNPAADGRFHIPQASNLTNEELEKTQRAAAEKALGMPLKPVQVSGYWLRRGTDFIIRHPGQALGLYWRKILLIASPREIPNNVQFEYLRAYHVTFLKYLLVSYAWLLPLAVAGICIILRQDSRNPHLRLLAAFLLVYGTSLLLFFVTSRYRLPLLPMLIVFAALAVEQAACRLKAGDWRRLSIYAGVLVMVVGLMQMAPRRYPYSHSRILFAERFLARYERAPDKMQALGDLVRAIVECKQALEVTPAYTQLAYRLSEIYYNLGYFSGALAALEWGLAHERGAANSRLYEFRGMLQENLQAGGDRIRAGEIPLSPYEKALEAERAGEWQQARRQYQAIIAREPYHTPAFKQWVALELQAGEGGRALRLLRCGLRHNPGHPELLEQLAGVYEKRGDARKAEGIRKKIGP